MSKELWLLRHGKSDRDVIMADFDRPLKKRGGQEALRMGEWMKQQQLIPDTILSSPAIRAITTATRVADRLGIKPSAIRQDPRLYFQGIDQLKAVLAECPAGCQRLLLVGHNPDLEELLLDLADSATIPDDGKLLPTATLARLRLDSWHELKQGCAQLQSITRAKHLPVVM